MNVTTSLLLVAIAGSAAAAPSFDDPKPQKYVLQARASKLDSRFREYPKIDFVFGTDKKPADLQFAAVDTRVKPRGELVIWLMRYPTGLFDRLTGYGLHAIQPHYANRWFSKVCQQKPVGEHCRGNMRLEAATGEDHSDEAGIQKPDGMKERARVFVTWLVKQHPQGKWAQFLTADGKDLRWDKIIVAGSSHGSTTSARFAKHQKVARVVMLCGPRDQYQTWQSLLSATPQNRYFGFSHVLDGGWTADHYCRSWELLGLHHYGPIVNVDNASPPYGNSRRLITSLDVKNNTRRAHSAVTPGSSTPKNPDGSLAYEDVWRYMFTHPVGKTGDAVPTDKDCVKDQRARDFGKK
ncbi:MAG: BPSS1187 family protein [Limisphaerales bacterium]